MMTLPTEMKAGSRPLTREKYFWQSEVNFALVISVHHWIMMQANA